VKNYSKHIYDAAVGHAPAPTVHELMTRDPRDLGAELADTILPTTAFRRLCHAEMRPVLATWLRAHFGLKMTDAPTMVMHGLDMTGHGILETEHGRYLVDSVMIPLKGWNDGILQQAVASAALVKAHATGCCDGAYVLVVNQNSLKWALWEVEVPRPSYLEKLFAQFRERAAAYEEAYEGHRRDRAPGVEGYPVVSTRHVTDEQRMASIVKELALVESAKRRGGVISPSEVSITSCDRRIAYALKKTPKVDRFPTHLYRVFAYGTAIHNLTQRLLLDALPDLVDEMTVENKSLRIYGSADVGDLADMVMLEIKSMSTHQHKKLRSPKSDHCVQATIYARAGSLIFKVVIYLYVDKELYTIKELPTKADSSEWHRIASRCKGINETLKAGDMPPRTDKTSECDNCPVAYVCKPDEFGHLAPVSRVITASQKRRMRRPA